MANRKINSNMHCHYKTLTADLLIGKLNLIQQFPCLATFFLQFLRIYGMISAQPIFTIFMNQGFLYDSNATIQIEVLNSFKSDEKLVIVFL